MNGLDIKISRLEIRAEQLLIHLSSIDRKSNEAAVVRETVIQMLNLRNRYMRRRDRIQNGLPHDVLTIA